MNVPRGALVAILMSVQSSLKARFQRIFEERGTNASALAEKAGLARSHIRTMLGASAPNPTLETLDKIAKAANVSSTWLATGHGPWEPYEAKGQAPLAIESGEERRLEATPDEIAHLIDSAIVPGVHYPSHAIAISEILRTDATYLPADVTAIDYVRTLFDLGAKLAGRGERVTPSSIFRESMRFVAANRSRFAELLAERQAEGERWLRERGVEPRATPDPILDRLGAGYEAPPPPSAKPLAKKPR